MSQRLFGTVMTFAFAAISLLGHGGLHALPGGHDCHWVPSSDRTGAGHQHGHTHSHNDLGFCHHDTHSHGSNDSHDQDSPVGHHDDDCLICQWHGQGQVVAVNVAVSVDDGGISEPPQASSQLAIPYRLTTRFTRGPPTL